MSATRARGRALVTGASAGIGREFCEQLAARGEDLVLVARDGARLEALAAELRARHGIDAVALAADLSRDTDVDRVVARLAGEPPVTLLVNNAGFGTQGALADTPSEPQERMVRVHVLAAMRLTQAAAKRMSALERGGIVNVASVAAFVISPGNVNYCATKAYLVSLSESLALELAGTGVQVQALCPGFTHTEFHARAEMDKGQVPGWLWLDARRVVRDSLRALDRGGPVVCVPGLGYRGLVALLRLLPHRLLGRAARIRRGSAKAQGTGGIR
jgi:hypothetical protein